MRMHEFGSRLHPSILLLHGAGSDHTMWQPQIEQLSPRYHLLVPDLPGAGESPGPFVLEAVSAAIGDQLRRTGIERVHACGLSLGAMVGLHLAATQRDLVASLVLSGVQLRPPPVLMMVQIGIMRLTPWKLLGAEDAAEKRQVMDLIRAAHRVDLRVASTQVKAPTLVLCGAKDRASLRAARRAATTIPHATFTVVPGAGHQWNGQLPEVFNDALGTFVERQLLKPD